MTAAALKILSTHALAEVLAALGPQFERVGGRRLACAYDPSKALRRRIEQGEDFDVAIATRAAIDALTAAGRIDPRGAADAARHRRGNAKQDRARRFGTHRHAGGARRAELAVQQISELKPVQGADFVGPLPPDLQVYTTFTAGIAAGCNASAEAARFIAMLAAPATAPLIAASGLEAPAR
ncbi:MAG: substrate-binding domain-containing protein [Pseudolabrys sp.]